MCESQKKQATEGKSTAGSKIQDTNDGEEESAALQMEKEVSPGDLIWVKLHGNSWWPAQVVDENSVSGSSKPGNRSHGEVLVRLYGSYEYLYANPMKYYSEFKMILEQNNGSCYDILVKALEQDRSRRKSIKPKGQGSKATGTRADASKGKKKLNPNSPRAEENARRKNPRRKGSNVEDKARSRTSEQDEIQKKLKRKSPSTDKQAKANEQERVLKKQRKNSQNVEKMKPNSRSAKEAIKQNAVPKKMPKTSTSKEQKRGKTSKQGEEKKKVKPSSPSSNGKKSKASKQKKLLKEKTSSQSSERTSPGESPKSSARRTRVMQGLGLIAPPGSPFHKNGLI